MSRSNFILHSDSKKSEENHNLVMGKKLLGGL